MVIVTQNQYILASKIHHVIMDENRDTQEFRDERGRKRIVPNNYFQITVIYSPEEFSTPGNGFGSSGKSMQNNEQRECTVNVRGHVNAHKLFQDLVHQIREQMPDQLYLDKALERMIANTNFDALKDKDEHDDWDDEDEDDGSAKKVRRVRKAKRSGKNVLRVSKRGSKRRR